MKLVTNKLFFTLLILSSSLSSAWAGVTSKTLTETIHSLAVSSQQAGNKIDNGQWSERRAKLHVSVVKHSAHSIYASCTLSRSKSFCQNSYAKSIQFYQDQGSLRGSGKELFNDAAQELSEDIGIEW